MAVIISDACIGCKMCVSICPRDVLRFDEENIKSVVTYPRDCQLCNMCALDCPANAITVTPIKYNKPILSWG
jgi:NAD-dependent dihydropyrimidine dehydrogenase PreA subunit